MGAQCCTFYGRCMVDNALAPALADKIQCWSKESDEIDHECVSAVCTVPRAAQLVDLEDLPICPSQGCSLAFANDVAKGDTVGLLEHSLSAASSSGATLSTGTLCMQVVKPAAAVSVQSSRGRCFGKEEKELLSYAEVAMRSGMKDSRGRPAFRELATHFVCHAWMYDYTNFVAALNCWAEQNRIHEDTTYFWIDVFVVNQHIGNEYPMEWWSTRFAQNIGDIGNTILVLDPWQDPLPLKRAWVIWEIFCTVQTGARLHIAMRKDAMEDFSDALIHEFEVVQAALSSVDVGLSTAFHPKHKAMVHLEITKTLGFTKLNELVSLRLKRWLIEAATRQLSGMKIFHVNTQWVLRQGAARDAEENRSKLADSIMLQENLARLLRESGNLAEAEASFNDLLKDIERKLGRNDHYALSCLNQLAVTLQKAGKTGEALKRHRDCLGRRRRILGEQHEDTLQSASNLAVLLSHQKPLTDDSFRKARDLYKMAIQGREATIGPDNPRTLYTVSNLALLLSEAPKRSNKFLKEAAEGHERAVTKLSKTLQNGHPLLLAALHNQACHWIAEYNWREKERDAAREELAEQAAGQLQSVYHLRIEKLGREHPDTQETAKKLELLRDKLGLSRMSSKEERVSVRDLILAQFPELRTASQFKLARETLKQAGVETLKEELVRACIVDVETEKLTIGMQPFNVYARMAAGLLVQRNMVEEQHKLGHLEEKYIIAHNKPENDEMWESKDPAWLGKASMSRQHVLLTCKDLSWEWFNVLTFGTASGRAAALVRLEELKQAALKWVGDTKGWPSKKDVGLFVVVYPLTLLPSFHLHIVNMKELGPSYKALKYKMLPIDDAIDVLREETFVTWQC